MTLIFFAMFGTFFLVSQYFQLVLGYTPLESGLFQLPMAFVMIGLSPQVPKLVDRFGVRTGGARGPQLGGRRPRAVLAARRRHRPSGSSTARSCSSAAGMALTMTPLTTLIMSAVPVTKAGVGSAMNDTTRELGGALGVAVLGSLVTSTYASSLGDAVSGLSERRPGRGGVRPRRRLRRRPAPRRRGRRAHGGGQAGLRRRHGRGGASPAPSSSPSPPSSATGSSPTARTTDGRAGRRSLAADRRGVRPGRLTLSSASRRRAGPAAAIAATHPADGAGRGPSRWAGARACCGTSSASASTSSTAPPSSSCGSTPAPRSPTSLAGPVDAGRHRGHRRRPHRRRPRRRAARGRPRRRRPGACSAPTPTGLGARANDMCADLDGNLITGTLNLGPGRGFGVVVLGPSRAGGSSTTTSATRTDPRSPCSTASMTLIVGDTAASYYAYPYDPATGAVGARSVFGDVERPGGRPRRRHPRRRRRAVVRAVRRRPARPLHLRRPRPDAGRADGQPHRRHLRRARPRPALRGVRRRRRRPRRRPGRDRRARTGPGRAASRASAASHDRRPRRRPPRAAGPSSRSTGPRSATPCPSSCATRCPPPSTTWREDAWDQRRRHHRRGGHLQRRLRPGRVRAGRRRPGARTTRSGRPRTGSTTPCSRSPCRWSRR